jgi:peroxiredoxin
MSQLITGDTALDFTLPATNGQTYTLHEVLKQTKAVVLVFTCNHCPYARAWEDRINALALDYAGQGVSLLAINSNSAQVSPSDSWEHMIARANEKQFAFPYLYDESQEVAHLYGAQRTPEVFLFDTTGQLCYHGAPDDNYEDEQAVQHAYVREALDAVLAGQAATISQTPPVGCTIKWKKA